MYPRHLPANKRSNFICALLTALFIGSCAGPIAPPTSRLIGTDVTHVYRLGVGDKLKITVYGEKELSGEFEVGALGTVSMPLIGDVRARGRTIRVFRDQIRQRLAQGYLNDPRVNVDVMNYRAYFVQGEVRKPGAFTFKNGLTVRDAIAAAGGYSYRADKGSIYLVRTGDGREREVRLPTAMPLLPGDNIRVPERFF